MATSCAISAATPSTPRRWRSSTSSACSSASSQRPHDRVAEARAAASPGANGRSAICRHLRTPAPFIAMMPQWEFLDFLRDEARGLSRLRAARWKRRSTGFIEEAGPGRRRAAGGRRASCARRWSSPPTAAPRSSAAGCLPRRGPRRADGRLLVPDRQAERPARRRCAAMSSAAACSCMIDRGDYWQCAFLIPKGAAEADQARGIEAIREEVAAAAPELDLGRARRDHATCICSRVKLDRLTRWHRPGLLAIGDAAHAMSPIGGIGINLAIQDAVAAANILAGPLARRRGRRSAAGRGAGAAAVADPRHPGRAEGWRRTGSSAGCFGQAGRSAGRRCSCACSTASRCCAGSRPRSSASASGASMSARPSGLRLGQRRIQHPDALDETRQRPRAHDWLALAP